MISIAMATYNGEKYLGDQIDSILNQTIQDFELIVCDDCSTDNTWNILLDYQLHDKRIKCYRNEKNLGFKKNFEKAIGLCTGDYIALSDQDDVWLPDHLELLIDNIGNNDLIAGNCELIDSTGLSLGKFHISKKELKNTSNIQCDYLVTLCHRNLFQGSNILFKRQLLEYILPIPYESKYHDYWMAFMATIHNGAIILPKTTLKYRRHVNSVTYDKSTSAINIFFDKEYRKIVKKKRDEHILFLIKIQEKVLHDDVMYKILGQAIRYYKRLYSPAEWINIFYYVVNFRKMYLSRSVTIFIKKLTKILLCC